jgi:carbon monoxide dehydrogenase subunit G
LALLRVHSQPVRVIAFLLVPVIAVAIATAAGWKGQVSDSWYSLVGALCLAGVVVIVAVGTRRERKVAGRVDERVQMQSNDSSALFLAGLIDLMALIFAARPLPLDALAISGLAILWSLIWIPLWMRRIGTRTSVLIDRDPATVFAFVSDFRNEAKYQPSITAVEKITDGPIGPGTQFRSRVQLPNGPFEGVEEIVDYEPPYRVTSRVSGALRQNVGVLTLDAVPQGTRLRYSFESEITYSNALLFQGLMRWFMTLDMRAQRNAAWARLKQLLETQATGF